MFGGGRATQKQTPRVPIRDEEKLKITALQDSELVLVDAA
jgi:hypothetical protein